MTNVDKLRELAEGMTVPELQLVVLFAEFLLTDYHPNSARQRQE